MRYKFRPKHKERTKKKIAKSLTGHKLSIKTKKKISKSRRGQLLGSKNPAWKGGLTPLWKRLRECFKYRQWRSDVFTRDNFTCQECGERGCYLEAHHIESFIKILRKNKIKTYQEALACEELWNINNGLTLCKKCHNKTKNRWI